MAIRSLLNWNFPALLVATLLIATGCAGTDERDSPSPALRDKAFWFDVQPFRDTAGRVVRIDVAPSATNVPQKGVYRGGHARIDLPKGGVHGIVWQASEPFEMRFEILLSDEGDGAGDIATPKEPIDWKPADAGQQGRVYTFPLSLKTNNARSREVIAVKYWIRAVADRSFELDPVIIVRR